MECIEIRKVEEKDLRGLVDLLVSSVGVNEIKLFKALEERLPSERSLVLLAKSGKKPVGAILCTVREESEWSDGKLQGVVEILMVDEPFRRQGIGRRLFETSRYWFLGQGVRSVVCHAPADAEVLHAFLKRYGYSISHFTFLKETET